MNRCCLIKTDASIYRISKNESNFIDPKRRRIDIHMNVWTEYDIKRDACKKQLSAGFR